MTQNATGSNSSLTLRIQRNQKSLDRTREMLRRIEQQMQTFYNPARPERPTERTRP